MRSFIHAIATIKVEAMCEHRTADVGMFQLRNLDPRNPRLLMLSVQGIPARLRGRNSVHCRRPALAGGRPHCGCASESSHGWYSARHCGARTHCPCT